jgi:UDPglucose 6-dehydrogenase
MTFTNTSVGIIGLGFVGNAVRESYAFSYVDVKTVDPDPKKNTKYNYKDLLSCDAIFVCVPSPMKEDGSCDTSILEEVLSHYKDYQGVIISKVTAVPSVYKQLNKVYPNLVHAPEFLTASNAVRDYASATFAVIGGSVPAYVREAERIIRLGQEKLIDVHLCSIEEAALAKYVINSFLATKVVFMNEIKNLADRQGIDYANIVDIVQLDKRIGSTHLQVPGPDGQLGYGGACFPKDIRALLKYAESLDVNLTVIDTAAKKNTILRLTEPK